MNPAKIVTLDARAFEESIAGSSAAQIAAHGDADFLAREDGEEFVAWSHAAARAVLDDPDLAGERHLHTAEETGPGYAPQVAAALTEMSRSIPLFMAGAAHAHFRRLTAERYRAYAADMKEHSAPGIAALVADLDRSLPAGDRRWLLSTHCNRVFVDASGLDEADRTLVLALRDQMMTVDHQLRVKSMLHLQMSIVSLFALLRRRREAGAGIRAGSVLERVHVTYAPEDEDEMVVSQGVVLFIAMNDLVPESLFTIDDRLHAEPDLWPALAAAPATITRFVEEAIRVGFRMSATVARRVPEARDVAGCPFAAGARITVNLAAAGLDPRVMDAGTAFRPGPQSPNHLLFGARHRHCLGRWFTSWLGRRLVAERLRQAGLTG